MQWNLNTSLLPSHFNNYRINRTMTKLQSSILYTITLFITIAQPSLSQLMGHVNSRGLRGNITFDIRDDIDSKQDNNLSTSIVEIEAFIEADQLRWIQGEQDEDEFDSLQEILFDWSLHSSSLEPFMLNKCSNDDLGPTTNDNFLKTLPEGRSIVLDKLNRWSISVNKTTRELSSLIWSKSIRLKLAKSHEDKAGIDTTAAKAKAQKASTASTSDDDNKPIAPAKPPISRPKIAFNSLPTAASTPLSKPTFAPRPKPNISTRFKQQLNLTAISTRRRNRRQTNDHPLINNVTLINSSMNLTNSSSLAYKPKTDIITATNKRIVKLYGGLIVCANIMDVRNVKSAQAVFESQVAGQVIIRSNEDDVTLLSLNLYHIRSKVTTRHDWKIMASDILDYRREEEKCKYLQIIFDPNNMGSSSQSDLCNKQNMDKCRMGDLTKKHGQIQVAGQGRSSRTQLVDLNLPLAALEGSRSLFLVIYEVGPTKVGANGLPAQRQNILSCAAIQPLPIKKLEANFNMDGVRGSIKFSQRHLSEPTSISYDLFGLEGNIKHVTIRETPVPARQSSDMTNSKLCSNLGRLYGGQSLGNLTSRHGHLSVVDSDYEDHYMGDWIDLNLQLFGMQTISGRSILIAKNNAESWVCATLQPIEEPMNYAAARFYYPVVGKIIFAQSSADQHAPTGVNIEVYNPNGERDTDNHNWLVHMKPAMSDFYNWSQRCESVGDVYDPILASVGLNQDSYSRQCMTGLLNEPLRCRLGDTSLKSNIKLSLPVSPNNRERYFYTDPYLPLSGPHSILGRSLVIYDEFAPTQRGNRLACSTIKTIHPLKASVKSWDSGPSIPSNIKGSINLEQESVTEHTSAKLDLNGFNGNVENYAIHQVWVNDDREFPCSNDSLYEIYDPFTTEQSSHLPPTAHYGTTATVDRVKVGDLSRKHGSLEGLQSVQKQFRDNNLPLFAPNSIIGRSVVLRAAVNDFRWVCGNVELDFDKSSSRELIGIASFDEPRSRVAGYVRFFQLEHKDGSLSDTFIQVDLKPQVPSSSLSHSSEQHGVYSSMLESQQVSENHNWAVFVNQVGEDAFITADEVRCIAAGFKWNPYLAQDNLENYTINTCTMMEPDGCAMGDLGHRHGPLRLGPSGRRTLSDSNLPLVGNYTIMGKSLVIFDNKRPNIKLACANILPDIHLKSNVVIKQTPSFTVARFIEQMRHLLDATDWLMVPELRATKSVANGECVQMTIHFYGQRAHQMQIELNNLITLGTVRRSTRTGVDKISTHYRLCRAGQNNNLLNNALASGSAGCVNDLTWVMITIWLTINCFCLLSCNRFAST